MTFLMAAHFRRVVSLIGALGVGPANSYKKKVGHSPKLTNPIFALSSLSSPSPSPTEPRIKLEKMVKVTVNGKIIAESNQTIVVENNHYFPPDSVNRSLFAPSDTRCDPLPPSVSRRSCLTFLPSQHRLSMERVCIVRSTPPSSDNLIAMSPRTAAYYDADVEGKHIQDIAWYYPNPKEKATNIKNYVAFYKVTLYPFPCTRLSSTNRGH